MDMRMPISKSSPSLKDTPTLMCLFKDFQLVRSILLELSFAHVSHLVQVHLIDFCKDSRLSDI